MIEKTEINNLRVTPIESSVHMPPATWKGDCVGHIGTNDTFFWVLEGECFLLIEDQAAIIRPGQLAYLPKGKKRTYTHASEKFVMYEMAFAVDVDGKNLMELLGLDRGNYVVDIADLSGMNALFENSQHVEMYKNPIYDVAWCADIINIVKIYAQARAALETKESRFFEPVLQVMADSVDRSITTEELSAIIYMQPTYFIRKFKKTFGISPQNYFRRLKMFRAMNLLVSTELSVEEIARRTGMEDASYFSRFFKKNCGATPLEYRKAFRR